MQATTLPDIKKNLARAIKEHNGLSLDVFFSPLLEYYYGHEKVFGAAGDFITSPDVSPVFGVLLALRINAQKTNDDFCLLELGAGRGTMMRDMLNHAPRDFLQGLAVTIIERSESLAAVQKKYLQRHAQYINWRESLRDVETASVDFIVANEFFDCLLPRQFMLKNKKWVERVVTIDNTHDAPDNFCFAFKPYDGDLPATLTPHQSVKENVIYESHPAYNDILTAVARVLKPGGVITIIDYGNDGVYDGDNMQALYRHQPVDPLTHLGAADISASVSFHQIENAAKPLQLKKIYFDSQANFLQQLHGDKIAAKLIALGYDKNEIDHGYQRLIKKQQPTDMGRLFKIMELQKL